jgi:hypothetical protein
LSVLGATFIFTYNVSTTFVGTIVRIEEKIAQLMYSMHYSQPIMMVEAAIAYALNRAKPIAKNAIQMWVCIWQANKSLIQSEWQCFAGPHIIQRPSNSAFFPLKSSAKIFASRRLPNMRGRERK